MNMIGIIYKFTILTNLKRDGVKPFYVRQHWSNRDINHFLRKDCFVYDGSGAIWVDYIKNLKNKYPKNWRKLIRREILCVLNKYDEKLLNKLEEYFIKHEKAHSTSVRLRLSKDKKNRIWINNGIQSKFVNSELSISISWNRGRIYNRRTAV